MRRSVQLKPREANMRGKQGLVSPKARYHISRLNEVNATNTTGEGK